MTRHTCKTSAFTIIELIVAMVITALLMTLIFQLFQTTQHAVNVGMKTGEMLVESETLGTQLDKDATAMRGPDSTGGGGFLVIAQKLLYVDSNTNGTWDSGEGLRFHKPNGEEVIEPVRSDQLIFIRNASSGRKIHALTPKQSSQLDTDIQADYARVWYGHLIRTHSDGATTDTLSDGNAPNAFANGLVLGRQALLLADKADSSSNFTPASDIHAADATWAAAVNNSGTTISSPQLYESLTDVADQTLTNGADGILDDAGYTDDGSFDYPDDVYAYTVPANRPWVNTNPNTSDSTIEENYEAWRLAQMHMNQASNVSDFIVEFAGDYSPIDNKIDKDSDGNIKWYTASSFANASGSDSSKPVTYDGSAVVTGTAPNTAYYEDQTSTPLPPSTADAVFIFRDDDDQPFSSGSSPAVNSKWPYLIRIRYRMHDVEGQVQSTVLDNNGTPSDATDDTWKPVVGQWFEHVIAVQRP